MSKANIITIIRIVLVPLFVVILLTEMNHKEWIAFAIYVIAAVTDSLDGYIARRFKEVTALGKFLDPLADKLLVTSALIALVYLERVETWAATVIILRELFISAFRFYFLISNASFSASMLAKLKTGFQLVSVGVLIIYPKLPFSELLRIVGTVGIYLAVILTVYSGVDYIIKYGKVIRT